MPINEKELYEFFLQLYNVGIHNYDDALLSQLELSLDKAVTSYKQTPGVLVQQVISTLINLGNTLYSKSSFKGALIAYQSALKLCETFCPILRADTAYLFALVGNAHTWQDNHWQAMKHFQIAHGIYVFLYGRDHPTTKMLDLKTAEAKAAAYNHPSVPLAIMVEEEPAPVPINKSLIRRLTLGCF